MAAPMRGRRSFAVLFALAFLAIGSPAGGAVRDDTDALQARLDAGGSIFLPKLPGGQCYATRGLWVSRDDTAITSDGACLVALGFGPARLDPTAPKPHYANAVFYVNHSDIRAPVPARIAISGLRITVPKSKHMHGVAVVGHEVSLSNLVIDGAPLNDVVFGFGEVGSGGPTVRVSLTGSTLRGAQRDAVLAYGPVGLRVDANTVARARRAGVHVRAADRGQPVLDTHIVGNTIADNAGPGVFVDLDPANGQVLLAKGIEVARNQLLRNARAAVPKLRGGIVVAGKGEVALAGNVFRGNRGRAVVTRAAAGSRRPPPSAPSRRRAAATTRAGSSHGSIVVAGRFSCRSFPAARATRRAGCGCHTITRRSHPTARASSRSGSARSGCTRPTATRSPPTRSSSSTVPGRGSRHPST